MAVIPLIALPAIVFANWARLWRRYRETGRTPGFGTTELFRMGDLERVITLLATIALFIFAVAVGSAGTAVNTLAGAGLGLGAALLCLDFFTAHRRHS